MIGSIATHLIDLVDAFVCLYIELIIPPFVGYYGAARRRIFQHSIWKMFMFSPLSCSTIVTYYSRAALVVPTVSLLATNNQRVIPALLIQLNFLCDILVEHDDSSSTTTSTSSHSSDDGFHVISTGSAQSILSWTLTQVLY